MSKPAPAESISEKHSVASRLASPVLDPKYVGSHVHDVVTRL
jgi:hypothetical protein